MAKNVKVKFLTGNGKKVRVPKKLIPLMSKLADTNCMQKSDSIIMESLYEYGGLAAGKEDFAIGKKRDLNTFPAVGCSSYVLVIGMHGKARCDMFGYGTLVLRKGQFYFFRLAAMEHLVVLQKARLHGFGYIHFDAVHMENLMARYEYSGTLQRLYEASLNNTSMLVEAPHQVVDDRMGNMVKTLFDTHPVTIEEKEKVMALKLAIIEAAIQQSASVNKVTPLATKVFDVLYEEVGGKYYRQQLRAVSPVRKAMRNAKETAISNKHKWQASPASTPAMSLAPLVFQVQTQTGWRDVLEKCRAFLSGNAGWRISF